MKVNKELLKQQTKKHLQTYKIVNKNDSIQGQRVPKQTGPSPVHNSK